ncbi:MAG TPA: HD domain-containing phosphohydrolase [Thermoanaerobaculia bacterium]|nr:HD domain-containing phosphohydrolase [Thermoanaerobaculia bacterium]
MNLVSPSRAASVPSGTMVLYRFLLAWFARLNGGVLLISLAAGTIAGSVRTGNPFVAWAAGLLGGWPGVLGASVGQLLGAWAARGSFRAALGLSVSVALSGAVAFLVFRHVPGIGRGLPSLGSYLWALESALLGGLLTAFGNTLVLGGFPGPRFWTGAAESLISVLLLGPPVLFFSDRYLRRWMEPIPGERPARRPRRLAGDPFPLPTSTMAAGDATVVLSAYSQPEGRRVLLWGGGMVLAVTLIAVPLSLMLPRGGSWAVLLYVIPILWSALEYGLRGGILAASGSGLFYLLGTAWMGTAGLQNPGMDIWSRCADLLILSLVGAFVGRSREHEVRLRDELGDSNRLLRRDLLRVAQALTQAVEAKDSYTEGHLRRVSEYAVAVGSRMGLRGHDLEMIHYASLLHDLGKIGIPEEILRKRGALTEQEAETMRRHPDIGARLLEKLDLLRDAAPLVRAHQERFDGETDGTLHPGYPFGLKGEEIPVGARIIAVVDAFDAMTTTRPYRAALPVESAIAELRNQRGKQFDPQVVDAFLDELADRPWVRDESWH